MKDDHKMKTLKLFNGETDKYTITKGAVAHLFGDVESSWLDWQGATGTGKNSYPSRSSQKIKQRGIPVFLADIKGDLSGLAKKRGAMDSKIRRTLQTAWSQSIRLSHKLLP